ncbi:ABC transporter ATP-binding protein [Microbacterium hominis]|uniref:ABC-type quaternary amine transporter n=1 Tax=Microbacterium hominis TaxID=162426 RepID=A0A7D4PKZ2_9MICO|nr:ABC transporter ATP-binding protein [Microbacterium hominis]QKJ18555.1 ABC transporter ATP-binding protein [Microbacterium hominis]
MTLRLQGVSKSFGGTEVLQDVSLEVPRGTRLALVGASGSGKTTLLRLVAGFVDPDGGIIRLGDDELAGNGRSIPTHRRGIGYVAQDGALFPHLSVARNIAFGLPRGSHRKARVRELLELASLHPDLADRMPHELSGGQQQRVALARALAQRPSVILLDEPFSALDTGLRSATRDAVVDVLERSGVTAVLVTHDQHEALSFGHQVGVLSGGRLVQSGDPMAVYDAPIDADVAVFLGDALVIPARAHSEGVDCGFGRLTVRHDLSGGARRVQAMVRPAQLRVAAAAHGAAATLAPVANGFVTALRPAGSTADIRLRVGEGEFLTEFGYRVPQHRATAFAPGTAVRVIVEGGVVLYAAQGEPGAGHRTVTPEATPATPRTAATA